MRGVCIRGLCGVFRLRVDWNGVLKVRSGDDEQRWEGCRRAEGSLVASNLFVQTFGQCAGFTSCKIIVAVHALSIYATSFDRV